jgi:hypothetical protein
MTATEAYKKKHAAALAKLKRIQHDLAEDQAKQRLDPRDWGYARNLEYVNAKLDDIMGFLQVTL